jgi:hypothetical protein
MSDLASLLEKVRSAQGPDRALDWHVADATGHESFVPAYTASIDAALALVERKLPGWRVAMYTDGEGKGPCCLALRGDEPVKANCQAPTLPLAILAAMLTALITQETPNGN